MDNQINQPASRMHPLVAGAAVSVILVSLLGVAAITGVIPSSHGTSVASSSAYPDSSAATVTVASSATPTNATRYVTPDGQILQAVPNSQLLTPVGQVSSQPVQSVQSVQHVYEPAPVVRRKVVHHYAQNSYTQPVRTIEQQSYAQPVYVPTAQHPVQNYVNDMHPVGTGVGAVVGGLLGNQVGGGNGRKAATVAGLLLGGYAGNEVAHNRNPLAW